MISSRRKMEQIQSAEQLEQCILAATNPLSPSKDVALNMLNHMCNAQVDGGAQLCGEVLNLAFSKSNPADATQCNQENSVVFYALTTLQRALCKTKGTACIVPYQCRDSLRQIIYHHIFKVPGQTSDETQIMPKYMRTKVGVVVALLIKHDFIDRWQNAFQELIQLAACEVKPESIIDITRKEIFLRVLNAFCDEVVEDTTLEKNTLIKDVIRGMKTSISCEVVLENTISADIIKALISLFQCNIQRMFETNGTKIGAMEARKLPIRSLSVLKRFISWVDLSLVANETVIGLLISSISHAGAGDAEDEDGDGSLPSQCAAEAVECMKEIIGKGMEDDKKIELIYNVNLLERIMSSGVNLETVDGTHINVVIKIAELVNSIGSELLRHWTSLPLSAHDLNRLVPHLNILTEIFFKCFAYDDIDVSGAVVPLASQYILLLQKEMEGLIQNKQFLVSPHLPQMLSVMYNQMKYPSDFEFDYEDEDEAEEEVYRSELRKLNQTIIRASPGIALQFLCTTLSQVPTPLSSSTTNEIEAALRLIYHYCEGIRPPPGTKVVLKDPTFCEVLIALHTSDITSHPHREVLILYYDIAVRYADLLKEKPELLPNILGSISGTNGLQHPHPRVRSRCCYLLLKLVKSLGQTLRQFVETAIIGINGLISHQVLSLHPDDSLYLFETIGLLLGQTDIGEDDQRKYLIDIMMPHMKLIESLLRSPELEQDPQEAGEKLSYSIASIAFLSKGFGRNISAGAQSVLKETVQPCLNILQAMPTSAVVRNKILIYLQRMVYCVGSDMLQVLQPFLEILIANCFQEDILDVAQLMNQLCIKFKADAMPIVDVCVLPLLHKATELLPDTSGKAQADIPPHILTEILHLKKIMLVTLYTITNSECAAVLVSPRNITSLEHILKMAKEGALTTPEPVVKKTSVQIFVCLTEHWLATTNPNIDASITTGFRSYLMDQFLPTMIQVFLSKNFNEKNLNEFRLVREVANIFFILQTKCDFDLPQYLANIVSSQTQQAIDPATYNVFHNPTSKKDTEKAMKFFILQVKPKLV